MSTKMGSKTHIRRGLFAASILSLLLVSELVVANVWSDIKTPYPVTLPQSNTTAASEENSKLAEVKNADMSIDSLAIGSYANGCLAGAKALPLIGEGYQVIRTSRKRYYGHPKLIAFVQSFAKSYAESINRSSDKLSGSDLLIGDISMPRGGNFESGHSSHQIGLDVDIWFRQVSEQQTFEQSESPVELSLVDNKSFVVNSHWQSKHAEMIKQAADNPLVARVFVNPAIKQKLCELNQDDTSTQSEPINTQSTSTETYNAAWLSKVRPWWGHKIHMHVRLHCPMGDTLCRNQPLPESGSGCDKLSWWKEQVLRPAVAVTPAKPKPKRVKVKPEQCQLLLR